MCRRLAGWTLRWFEGNKPGPMGGDWGAALPRGVILISGWVVCGTRPAVRGCPESCPDTSCLSFSICGGAGIAARLRRVGWIL